MWEWKCGDESAGMKMREWKCGDESEGVKNAGNENAGVKMQGWKCGDENAGMKKLEMKNLGMKMWEWKCGDENAGMKNLGMNYQGMKNLGVKKLGMKTRGWSVTQPWNCIGRMAKYLGYIWGLSFWYAIFWFFPKSGHPSSPLQSTVSMLGIYYNMTFSLSAISTNEKFVQLLKLQHLAFKKCYMLSLLWSCSSLMV